MNVTDKIVQENKDKIDLNISNYLKKKKELTELIRGNNDNINVTNNK